jgi:hypothetical protein
MESGLSSKARNVAGNKTGLDKVDAIAEGYCRKVFYYLHDLLKLLTPELNPSAQRCLTRFFLLGILLLKPCISLIYV